MRRHEPGRHSQAGVDPQVGPATISKAMGLSPGIFARTIPDRNTAGLVDHSNHFFISMAYDHNLLGRGFRI